METETDSNHPEFLEEDCADPELEECGVPECGLYTCSNTTHMHIYIIIHIYPMSIPPPKKILWFQLYLEKRKYRKRDSGV